MSVYSGCLFNLFASQSYNLLKTILFILFLFVFFLFFNSNRLYSGMGSQAFAKDLAKRSLRISLSRNRGRCLLWLKLHKH